MGVGVLHMSNDSANGEPEASGDPIATDRVVVTRRLLWVGPLALVASLVATVLIRTIAVAAFDVPSELESLRIGAVILLTIVGVVGAVAVFAVISKWARRPVQLYLKIAVVALLLSWVPDIDILISEPYRGTGVDSVGTLMSMHAVVAVITVTLLIKLTRGSAAG